MTMLFQEANFDKIMNVVNLPIGDSRRTEATAKSVLLFWLVTKSDRES